MMSLLQETVNRWFNDHESTFHEEHSFSVADSAGAAAHALVIDGVS
jgi:hypothetical protein